VLGLPLAGITWVPKKLALTPVCCWKSQPCCPGGEEATVSVEERREEQTWLGPPPLEQCSGEEAQEELPPLWCGARAPRLDGDAIEKLVEEGEGD